MLVPTAHDEPPIQLGIFKEVFSRPAAVIFNTESEQRFVKSLFPERPLLEEIAGVGVDLPQHNPYPRMPEPPDEEGGETGEEGSESVEELDEFYNDSEEPEDIATPSRPIPRRASLANDTIGGPLY